MKTIPILPAGRELPAPAGGGMRLAALPPLALYVHFPWCVRKCPYCDFNSHEAKAPGIPEDDYVAALIADLDSALPDIWGRPVVSIFFGGGTPSLLTGRAVDNLLAAFRARLPLQPGAEVTLEANPGAADAGRFADYRGAGVNRLSLGIQSFDDGWLAALGRIHDSREARLAIELARRHFDNLNLDLMYGLPGQDPAGAARDLEAALGFAPEHLSAYHLTLEPNTPFHRAPPQLPDPDLAADMQDQAEEMLAAAGYDHYETSAFARPGRQCRHNLNYWQFGDYLGIGAGAHSKLSFLDRVERQARPRHPRDYLATAGTPQGRESLPVPVSELPFEFMMNALRLEAGFPTELYRQRTGLDLDAVAPMISEAEQDGLISRSEGRMAPTARGRRFLNVLLGRFLG